MQDETTWLAEPLGLLHGEAADSAVRSGDALPLMGGPAAFSLLRLHGRQPARIVRVDAVPGEWQPALARVTRAPPLAGLPAGVLVMGILNVTPDSFSDGGRHDDLARAVAHGRRMVAEGAAILDIGGESTRPEASPVSPEEEQRRVLPVIGALLDAGMPISIDTRNAATMQAALARGARVINDVTALAHDPRAAPVVVEAGCPVVLMHMRGTPQTMRGLAQYGDVAAEVTRELAGSVERAVAAGIGRERIVVDPGIGFAKTAAQNAALLRRLPILANLGCRVLLGVSRKGFVGAATGVAEAPSRLAGSLVAALPGLALPGTILRVHDVAETVQAVRMWQVIADEALA